MDLINSKSDDIDTFRRLRGRLKGMRSTAIEKGGEYAPENLAFKELRNRGVLDKMNKYLRNLEDQELTLESKEKCKDGYRYDKEQKRCVRKRPYHTGIYYFHSMDHDHDSDSDGSEVGSGGGGEGGGGGE